MSTYCQWTWGHSHCQRFLYCWEHSSVCHLAHSVHFRWAWTWDGKCQVWDWAYVHIYQIMPNSASSCLPDHGVSPDQSLSLSGLLILANLVRIWWYFMVVLISIFLVIKYVEIFSCSFNFWVSLFLITIESSTHLSLSSAENIVIDLREKRWWFASGACPSQGSHSLPRSVPGLAVTPTALWCTGWPSSKWSHRPGLRIFCAGLFAAIFMCSGY